MMLNGVRFHLACDEEVMGFHGYAGGVAGPEELEALPACGAADPVILEISASCSFLSIATKISLSSDQDFFLGFGPLTHSTWRPRQRE